MKFLELLSVEQIAKLYHHFAGIKTTVKFKDRQTAEIRLLNVAFGKLPPVMREAFKTCDFPESIVNQYKDGLNNPVTAPNGLLIDKPKDLAKYQKSLAAAAKRSAAKAPKEPNAAALTILLALRELSKTQEDGNVSTADVAKKLDTNTTIVCKSARQLATLGLIKMEDDSPETEEGKVQDFFYLTVLQPGKDLVIHPKAVAARLPNSTPGPRSSNSGQRIYRIPPHDKTNPRREGTHGWNSFNVIRDGMTVEEYRAAGGRNNDLAWDVDHGFLELRANDAPPPEPKKEVPAAGKKAAAAAPPPKEKAKPSKKVPAVAAKKAAAKKGNGKKK